MIRVSTRRGRAKRRNGFGDVLTVWRLAERVPPGLPDLEETIYGLISDPRLSDETFDLLAAGYPLISGRSQEEIPEAEMLAAQSAAGLGYMARRAEYQRSLSARKRKADALERYVDPAIAAASELARNDGERVAVKAADLAITEALDPGVHDRCKPSFEIPGLSVTARSRLREETLALAVRPGANGALESPHGEVDGAALDDLRRVWKYGYFLRRLQELSAD